jgi:hypothetical protein
MMALQCRCCGSPALDLVFDLGLQPWGNHFIPMGGGTSAPFYPLELYFCTACAMVQIGYTVPKERMFRDHRYLSGTTKSLARHFAEV